MTLGRKTVQLGNCLNLLSFLRLPSLRVLYIGGTHLSDER